MIIGPDTFDSQKDELLVIRCQLGERAAFEDLIERWHPPLWVYLRRITGSDDAAKDVAQDVWLRVIRGIAKIRDRASLRAWLFGIARRALMDRFRQQYARREDPEVDVSGLAAATADDSVEEQYANLDHELESLPLIEREVLTLFYLRELSLAQVSEILAVPVGTVKSRLSRARRLLRNALESKGIRR